MYFLHLMQGAGGTCTHRKPSIVPRFPSHAWLFLCMGGEPGNEATENKTCMLTESMYVASCFVFEFEYVFGGLELKNSQVDNKRTPTTFF